MISGMYSKGRGGGENLEIRLAVYDTHAHTSVNRVGLCIFVTVNALKSYIHTAIGTAILDFVAAAAV
jgi:hypothetical protein